MKLQKTLKGQYFILLPDEMIRITRWKEGDEIELRLASDVPPRKQDLILRKV